MSMDVVVCEKLLKMNEDMWKMVKNERKYARDDKRCAGSRQTIRSQDSQTNAQKPIRSWAFIDLFNKKASNLP